MKDEFSTLDIVKALGIPRERLRDWMDRKYITPTTVADGKGTRAIFTLSDVYAVALFRSLTRYGLKRSEAAKSVGEFMKVQVHKNAKYIIFRESIGSEGPKRRSSADLATLECKINLEAGIIEDIEDIQPSVTRYGDLSRADKEWRMILIVNFGTLRKEVDAAVAKL